MLLASVLPITLMWQVVGGSDLGGGGEGEGEGLGRGGVCVQRVVRYEPPAAYAAPHYSVSTTVWPVAAGLATRRRRFEPRHVYDRLMVYKVALVQVSLLVSLRCLNQWK